MQFGGSAQRLEDKLRSLAARRHAKAPERSNVPPDREADASPPDPSSGATAEHRWRWTSRAAARRSTQRSPRSCWLARARTGNWTRSAVRVRRAAARRRGPLQQGIADRREQLPMSARRSPRRRRRHPRLASRGGAASLRNASWTVAVEYQVHVA